MIDTQLKLFAATLHAVDVLIGHLTGLAVKSNIKLVTIEAKTGVISRIGRLTWNTRYANKMTKIALRGRVVAKYPFIDNIGAGLDNK